jgi:hypothetical protein
MRGNTPFRVSVHALGLKRVAIVTTLIAGATVPLVLATLFFFGCCVRPFQGVAHKMMPMCHSAARQTSVPAQQKEAPPKRIVSERIETFRLTATSNSDRLIPTAATSYRSFITLGAIRCDRDVGLHVLVDTFLI